MNRFAAVVLCLMLFPAVGSAQWTVDSTVNTPVCTATDLQNNVQIVSDGSGGAVIAWQDQRNASSTQTDVYAQRLDSAGYPQWQQDGVALSTRVGLQQQLNIAADTAGGAVAVWRDQYRGIIAQRVLGNGVIAWNSEGTQLSRFRNHLGFPKIVRNTTGGFIASWSDDRNSRNNIYAQGIDDTGGIRWTIGGVRLKPNNISQSQPVMIARESGGAIVVWMESGLGVVAQAVADDGSLPWGNAGRVVCSISGGNEYPKLVSDGNDGAIIAWTDYRNGNADIYAQHIAANGNATWRSEGNEICFLDGIQSDVDIAPDGMGGAIITWDDDRTGAAGIYAQRINLSGTLLWQTNGVPVCNLAVATPNNPRIVTDGQHGGYVVWEDSRNSSRQDIYMQRIDEHGAARWQANGVAISVPPRSQSSPRLIPDGEGNAIVAWEDSRLDGIFSDVYAAKTSLQGPIPVEYVLFEPSLVEGQVLLHWVTESETNSYVFHVERSVDGSRWERIGTVQAAGTSSERITYTFTDPGPFSGVVIRYRLRQVDVDGTWEYSPIVNISAGTPTSIEIISVYPNPVAESAILTVSLPFSMPVEIGVYTALGTLLERVDAPTALQAGSHDIALPVGSLIPGSHIVVMSTPHGVHTTPLIVLR